MWAQILNTALGIWLMIAPAVLDVSDAARTNDRIVGPLAASFACVALWEVLRPLRKASWLLGAWLLLAPWLLDYSWSTTLHSLDVGLLLISFASVRGRLRNSYGGGWSLLWNPAASRPS